MPVEFVTSVLAFVVAVMVSVLAYIWVRTVGRLEKDIEIVNGRVSKVKEDYLPRAEAKIHHEMLVQQINGLKDEINRYNRSVGELLLEIRNENIKRSDS